jgi:zinc/manganese transport system substrate-binding protein
VKEPPVSLRPLWFTAAAVAGLVAMTGCGSSTAAPGVPAGKIPVVASTNVWGSVAAAVGGDLVAVKSLIDDPSADPHAYPDKPSDATALHSAKLAVYNGGGYDEFFSRLADAAGGAAKRVVAFDIAGKGPSGETNEHVWYDLPTVHKVADRIAEELGAVSPKDKATFAANAKAFGDKVDALAGRVAEIGKGRPGGKVVSTEPVAYYLEQAAGLADVTPEDYAEAIEEETDPPAAAVASITQLVAGKQVSAVVNNAQTETSMTTQLKQTAARAGVPVVDVTETLPEGVTSYVDWMTRQVDALAGALAHT